MLHWRDPVELSLDCCICERTGRTVFLRQGQERAVCTSDEKHGRHMAPARIAAFDTTTYASELALRAVVAYWWAPLVARFLPWRHATDHDIESGRLE